MAFKILFVDIDGVLNSSRGFAAKYQGVSGTLGNKRDMIEQIPALLIKRIVEETGCLLVLSSSWREGHSIAEVSKIIALWTGVNLEFTGATPYNGNPLGSRFRGGEISEYLRNMGTKPDKYCILDDFNQFFIRDKKGRDQFEIDQPFVQTDGNNGISYLDYITIVEWFNSESHDRLEVQKRITRPPFDPYMTRERNKMLYNFLLDAEDEKTIQSE